MNMKPSEFGGLFSCMRILVVGANGAGKTVFANKVADRLGIPVFHNDAFALLTDWTYRPRSEIDSIRTGVLDQPRWILEGGPSLLTEHALRRADFVVWLDLPKGLRVRRIFWRCLRFIGQTRPEHPSKNVEWPGPRQCRFIVKAWRRDAETRRTVSDRLGQTRVLHLTSQKAVNAMF